MVQMRVPCSPSLPLSIARRKSMCNVLELKHFVTTLSGFMPFMSSSFIAVVTDYCKACMLSRMFSAEEATSVWVELVEKRGEEIEREYGRGFDHSQSFAARQEISRSQLRHWDASARSWIQTADDVHLLQQKRLMLFAKNVDQPVNDHPLVYQSVIGAWKNAMTAIECLLKGMPQMIHEGAVLLALSAWHIYPDIIVMKREETVETKFQDSLVPVGGLLTIPTKRLNEQDGSGVRWSLSLAHLRYYGEPVKISRYSGAELSRITFEQLGIVVLGSIAAGWGYDQVDELQDVAKFFTEMWGYLERYHEDQVNTAWKEKQEERADLDRERKKLLEREESKGAEKEKLNGLRGYLLPEEHIEPDEAADKDALTVKIQASSVVHHFLTCDSGWMAHLVNVSRKFLHSTAAGDIDITALAKLGQRRGRIFLGHKRNHPPSVFGLRRAQTRLRLLKNEEKRIMALRRIALECGLDKLPEGAVLIRYYHLPPIEQSFRGHYEYASAIPHTRYTSTQGTRSSLRLEAKGHSRWIGFSRCDCAGDCHDCVCAASSAKCTAKCHPTVTVQRQCSRYNSRLQKDSWQFGDEKRASDIAAIDEDCFSLGDTFVKGWEVPQNDSADDAHNGEENEEETQGGRKIQLRSQIQRATKFQWCNAPKQFSLNDEGNFQQRKNVTFKLLCGDPQTAAIYLRIEQPACQETDDARQWKFQLGEITKVFENNSFTEISPNDLVTFLTNLGPRSESEDSKKGTKSNMRHVCHFILP
jgi:hypothetical protein